MRGHPAVQGDTERALPRLCEHASERTARPPALGAGRPSAAPGRVGPAFRRGARCFQSYGPRSQPWGPEQGDCSPLNDSWDPLAKEQTLANALTGVLFFPLGSDSAFPERVPWPSLPSSNLASVTCPLAKYFLSVLREGAAVRPAVRCLLSTQWSLALGRLQSSFSEAQTNE